MNRALLQRSDEGDFSLSSEEAHHLIRVRRLRIGESFLGLAAGQGWLKCELLESAAPWQVRVLEAVESKSESPLRITLGQSLIKKDRFDWVVQKATELGVHDLVPLNTWRSEVRMGSKPEKKLNRWRKIAQEAVKQCGRIHIPEIAPVEELGQCLKRTDYSFRICLDESAEAPMLDNLPEAAESCLLLVGPEGGWDERDRELVREAGVPTAGLGPRVLRTETAPIVALSILQHRLGDL